MTLTDPILIFDGACGSSFQSMAIPDSAFAGHDGCNEYLNLTAGEIVREHHRRFLTAGATVIETNTFGACDVVLADYGIESQVEAINTAAVEHARAAVAEANSAALICGSIGPTSKLPILGHIAPTEMIRSYRRQICALIDAGVDMLIFETCQDILQSKLAIVAAHEAFDACKREVPICVSVTIEQTGTMLAGSDIATTCATLRPMGIFSLGLNCATGPALMAPHIQYLCDNFPGRVSCIPNAGLPELIAGETVYPLSPSDYATSLHTFVTGMGVSVVGGCCGTTPEHIAALTAKLDGETPAERTITITPQIASAYQAVDLHQEPRPLMIGERCNANGSKKFRELLLDENFDGAMQIAHAQQNAASAHALDLCVAYAGRDEMADMTKLVSLMREAIRLPMVIDSTNPAVIEAALQHCPGRPIINSIHLEDGGDTLGVICKLAKRYGAALIALTIDEDGMAMTADRKLAVAKRIHDLATGTYGLESCDLIFDPLTFTVGSGDETLRTAGIETLNALKLIQAELPGVLTTLGLSNISFGLKGTCRKVLNSVFLHEAVAAGLSTAIVHAAMILPTTKFTDAERELCLDLIYNRRRDADHDPIMAIIEAFADHSGDKAEKPVSEFASREDQLQTKVLNGDREDLDALLAVLRRRYRPVDIINRFLIPSMRHVGELFGRGDMLLPFVLASAETMRAAVDILKPYMHHEDSDSKTKILLATVAGDVHDIGKNLVDIILSNNGYTVYNLGIKIGIGELIEKAKELRVDLIGLSGLLVKSTVIMRDNLRAFEEAGISAPVLLGGAALTPGYVAGDCVDAYPAGKVVYCKDAFEGLRAVGDFEAGTLTSTLPPEKPHTCTSCCIEPGKPVASAEIEPHTAPVPATPERVIETDITLDELFGAVNKAALFRARWGLKKQDRTDEEFADFLATEAEPRYAALRELCEEKNLLEPTILRAFYPCRSDGNTVWVTCETGEELPLRFPRQRVSPGLCLADYYHHDGDHIAMHVVTIGAKLDAYCHELYEAGEFQDYLFLHSLGVELTEAAADIAHERIRRDWGVEPTQGCRWSFGYSSCPNLDDQEKLFALLRPEEIGVTLTESMQMVPEFTTSAIASAHPQATYFSV